MTKWNDLFFNKIHADMVRRYMMWGNISIDELLNLVLDTVIDGKNDGVFGFYLGSLIDMDDKFWYYINNK